MALNKTKKAGKETPYFKCKDCGGRKTIIYYTYFDKSRGVIVAVHTCKRCFKRIKNVY